MHEAAWEDRERGEWKKSERNVKLFYELEELTRSILFFVSPPLREKLQWAWHDMVTGTTTVNAIFITSATRCWIGWALQS